jgi:predicted amidohydrolase YtcJ
MKQHRNRREFFGLTGAVLAGALAKPWHALAAEGDGSADLVVLNAKVYTVDSRAPKAQAFAIKGGRFLAVGTSDEMKSFIGKATQTYDAKGMTIVPGFIDCHNHAPGNTLLYDVIVGNPYVVEFVTIDSIVGKLKERAAKLPPGTWVEGYFFDDTKVKDGRELNVHDLDQVSKDHPVVVQHRGGHTSYYNSKALEMADINRNTPNTPGGTYDKFPDGSLNGRVTDRARTPFQRVGKHETFSPAETAQRNRDGIAFISRQFVKYGVTTVHHEGGDLNAIQEVRARGELLHRISYEANGRVLDAMIANGIETGFGDEWVRFGATSEHTVDGSYSERTMAISKPYPGVTPPYKGNVTDTQDELNAWAEKVHRAGIQLNCHANGDVAIDMTLTAYERALKAFPRKDSRPKITHCTLVNPELIRRMKAMDCVPAAFTSYAYYNSDKFHFYGEEMMKWMMAYRSFLDAGINVAAGSDFSPGPFDPRMAIQGMVTRKGWNGEVWGANQRISIEEALRVNTLNGAYNSHEENVKGSITPGKLADFVVLSDDLFTVDVEKIKDLTVVRTVVGGKTAYQA